MIDLVAAADRRFQECAEFVLARETEYDAKGKVIIERDPNDPGGTTKYGIDQRDHPGIDVATLSRPEAIEIYRQQEWTRGRCWMMNPPWDLAAFDSAVNPGMGWMPVALQKAVGAKPDGVLGPKTIAAVNAADEDDLVAFLRARCDYYRSRPATRGGRPFRDRYLAGWLNRVILLTEATLGRGLETRVMAA